MTYTITCRDLPQGYALVDYARAAKVSLTHHTRESAFVAAATIEAKPDCDGVVPVCVVLDSDGNEVCEP